jgi:DNA-directed RNA polymerase subunit L
MVLVKNIKVSDFNLVSEISNKNNKKFQRCLELLDKSNLELIPKRSKLTVSFELTYANTDLANAIRRCIIDEIPIKSFDFDEFKDFNCDDPYVLNDFIKKQIDLIPIDQDFDYNDKKMTFNLHIKNTSDEIIDVKSGDIKHDSKDPKVSKEDLWSPNIVLCKLRPGRNLRIDNIKICEGIGKTHAAKFNSVSNIMYEIVDVDPIMENRVGTTGTSSMLTNPEHFKMGYSTHRNTKHPLRFVISACDVLIQKLINIEKDIKKIKNSDKQYLSDLVTLESIGNLRKISIKGEYWTICNIISRYSYDETDGNIKFISPALIHPEKEVAVLNITHTEFSTVIQNAIKKIISDLETVKSSFAKI